MKRGATGTTFRVTQGLKELDSSMKFWLVPFGVDTILTWGSHRLLQQLSLTHSYSLSTFTSQGHRSSLSRSECVMIPPFQSNQKPTLQCFWFWTFSLGSRTWHSLLILHWIRCGNHQKININTIPPPPIYVCAHAIWFYVRSPEQDFCFKLQTHLCTHILKDVPTSTGLQWIEI